MTIQPGEFWVADIPFTSAAARSPKDVPLADWKMAGLRVPSTVRLSRLDCLEQTLLIHKLGSISAADASRVKAVWSAHVRPVF